MRLFETLSQFGALWVFLGAGLALGMAEMLWLCLRCLAGDPVWMRMLAMPGTVLTWCLCVTAAVEYAYPHGFRIWQAALILLGFFMIRLGPAELLARRVRLMLRNRAKVAQ